MGIAFKKTALINCDAVGCRNCKDFEIEWDLENIYETVYVLLGCHYWTCDPEFKTFYCPEHTNNINEVKDEQN